MSGESLIHRGYAERTLDKRGTEMLFDPKKIENQLALCAAELEAATADLGTDPDSLEKKERKIRAEQAGHDMSKISAVHRMVDLGEYSPESLVSGTARFYCDPVPYFSEEARPHEVILIPSDVFTCEHALMVLLNGAHGAAACTTGFHNQAHRVYVAPDTGEDWSLSLGRYALRALVPSMRCQGGNLFFGGAPVYLPDSIPLTQLPHIVSLWLRTTLTLSDGLLPWEGGDFAKIFGLASPDWWRPYEKYVTR